MSLPTVSIVVPVLNRQHCIASCIESLLNQNYPADHLDIIVVDNGSTDNTAKVVQQYEVKYLLEEKPGSYAARNRGARLARGEILAFIDSDCIADANWITEIVHALTSSGMDAVSGFSRGINRSIWAEFTQKYDETFWRCLRPGDASFGRMDTRNLAIRQHVFAQLGGFDERLLYKADLEFAIRFKKAGYSSMFVPQAQIAHINPVTLGKKTGILRRQGFFEYKIVRKHGLEIVCQHVPSFSRLYYRYVFADSPVITRLILPTLNLALEMGVLLLSGLLQGLALLSLRRGSFTVFRLVMDMAIFQGKVQARLAECRKDQAWYSRSCTRFVSV